MTKMMQIFAAVGIGFLCGVIPLCIAALTYYTSRKRGEEEASYHSAKKVNIRDIKPEMGMVQLQGRIAQVKDPVARFNDRDLCYLRFRMAEYDDESKDWWVLVDKKKYSPFLLDDGTGQIWVVPDGFDLDLLATGFTPDEDQIGESLTVMDEGRDVLRGKTSVTCWTLSEGDEIQVAGPLNVTGESQFIRKQKDLPFAILPIGAQMPEISSQKRKSHATTWTIVFGIIGAIMLLCSGIYLILALVRGDAASVSLFVR